MPRREAVRFVSASQPHAGDVFNAVPMRHDFRVPTWASMRIIVHRRLSLPLDKAYSLWRAHVHGAMHGARRSRSGSKGPIGS